ncbi:MAG: HD domain-containing protein [Candidatus Nanosalina sp.]
MDLKELREFFTDIDELKHTERQGWKDIGVTGTKDTIASHSLGATILGWSLAEEEGTDSDRVVKMLLMHDLIMSYVRDYTPEDEEFTDKKQMEDEQFEKLKQDMPGNIREETAELFHEFRENRTREAQVAHEADKLDTLLQALRYSEELGENHVEEFLETYTETFETSTGRKIMKQLKEVESS